jgi:hypothetical protein
MQASGSSIVGRPADWPDAEQEETATIDVANPRIQLLIFDGCPLADAARRSLQTALDSLELSEFEEIDLLDSATPDELKGWGSPTILINGVDVAGAARGAGVGCRVYDTPDRVPTPETIAKFIGNARHPE